MEKDIKYLLMFGRKYGFGAPKKQKTGGGRPRLAQLPAIGSRLSLTEVRLDGTTVWTTGTVVDHYEVEGQLNACIVPDGTTMSNVKPDKQGRLIPREFTYTLKEINHFITINELVMLDENQNYYDLHKDSATLFAKGLVRAHVRTSDP